MDNELLFYIFGIAAAVSAVVVSFVGLKVKSFPGRAFPLVILWFAVLVGGATTFSVLHAQDEEEHNAHELEQANADFEAEADEEPGSHAAAEAEESGEAEAGEEHGGRLGRRRKRPARVARCSWPPTRPRSPTTKKSLSSAPGEVTIDFNNPAALEHDVAIEERRRRARRLGSRSPKARPRSAPSSRPAPTPSSAPCRGTEAGMEGTLTVQ